MAFIHMNTHSGVTKALKRMNRQLNLPQLQKIMMEFERESEIMDLKEETISDTIDDAIGEDDEDEVRRGRGKKRGRERGRKRERCTLIIPPQKTHTHTLF